MNERLFITLPASLVLWSVAIILFAASLNREVERPMMGRDMLTVRLLSLSAPPSAPVQQTSVQPTPPQIIKPDKPAIKLTKPLPKPVQNKAVPKKAVVPAEPPKPQQKWTEAASDNHGAVITYQPLPKIPDDLREEAFSTFAVVRFHVAADNTATVELLTPSQNPRLNHILMETLKAWRFTSATDQGRPVASTFTIRVRFAVE